MWELIRERGKAHGCMLVQEIPNRISFRLATTSGQPTDNATKYYLLLFTLLIMIEQLFSIRKLLTHEPVHFALVS